MKVFILFQPDGSNKDFIGVFSSYDQAVNSVYRNLQLNCPPMEIEEWEVDGRKIGKLQMTKHMAAMNKDRKEY